MYRHDLIALSERVQNHISCAESILSSGFPDSPDSGPMVDAAVEHCMRLLEENESWSFDLPHRLRVGRSAAAERIREHLKNAHTAPDPDEDLRPPTPVPDLIVTVGDAGPRGVGGGSAHQLPRFHVGDRVSRLGFPEVTGKVIDMSADRLFGRVSWPDGTTSLDGVAGLYHRDGLSSVPPLEPVREDGIADPSAFGLLDRKPVGDYNPDNHGDDDDPPAAEPRVVRQDDDGEPPINW